jgi:hypothetical protein
MKPDLFHDTTGGPEPRETWRHARHARHAALCARAIDAAAPLGASSCEVQRLAAIMRSLDYGNYGMIHPINSKDDVI